jgi:hypothetical protein
MNPGVSTKRKVSPDVIVHAVAQVAGIPAEDMQHSAGLPLQQFARQYAMWRLVGAGVPRRDIARMLRTTGPTVYAAMQTINCRRTSWRTPLNDMPFHQFDDLVDLVIDETCEERQPLAKLGRGDFERRIAAEDF